MIRPPDGQAQTQPLPLKIKHVLMYAHTKGLGFRELLVGQCSIMNHDNLVLNTIHVHCACEVPSAYQRFFSSSVFNFGFKIRSVVLHQIA